MKITNITQKAIQEIEILYQQLNQSVPNQLIQSQNIFQHLLNIAKSNKIASWMNNIIKEDIINDNIHGGKKAKNDITRLTQPTNIQFKKLQGIYYLDRQNAGSYLLDFKILKTLLSVILSHIEDYENEWNIQQ